MEGQYVTREEFSKLDDKVDELQKEQTQTKQRVRHVEQKLDKIESNTTWILRLILGAFILAILGLVFKSPDQVTSLGGF
ncbi:Haemolysin XhlA [Halobacillus karajensis]|uniref:Haemolysin XhlA n=1 Tax=Halobacillus karajensis TaxID=195088 RepID=A0A024P4L7_9BACI|nr:hemolysin XhlA family protein [Halobacillus karajensis]CDQ20847.1 Haemolysin XhlA [Halobacillus karajensis]CDQ23683.1 Haemolysin XhlA [Halobacillus karajensis]CDQ27161.1 Haemolysin XhlA [Halobacillus karajensis]SEI03740.1 Haemolysin XhlA [Halobacillus karajensis]